MGPRTRGASGGVPYNLVMRTIAALALLALTAPVFATTWTSFEQLEGASRVDLRADLETQKGSAGASWTGARDDSGFSSSVSGAASSSRPKADTPRLAKSDKPEPPSPKEARILKIARAAGIGAAVAGLGIAALSVLSGGMIPLAALALVFVGGMAAYLAHRRLKGRTSGIFG